jgi:hypothetical protein
LLSKEHPDTHKRSGGIVSVSGSLWQALCQTRPYLIAHSDEKYRVPQIWSLYVMVGVGKKEGGFIVLKSYFSSANGDTCFYEAALLKSLKACDI